ncbi:hypothetical protein [Thermoactinomyces sp. DSM 45892]|uniref:hypothetical protein n=1 Tax=Thermoactinomyces sp. DSM 45892 TaxID=1882753 RepID=UPI00089B9B94|nr:hypothetical protein [Thermoactinomyces sp. DSM 45892]SDZ27033.1 hypothetical protein SAMN05444416_11849 [Thermoactinomyces sp. DSM 45892]
MGFNIVDLQAPIIPGKSIGGFQLRENIQVYEEIILNFPSLKPSISEYTPLLVEYEIKDTLVLIFNIKWELRHIIAYPNYKGTLFGKIRMGMEISEVMQIDNRFTFDDFDEVYYIPELQGLVIDTTLDEDDVEVVDRIAVFTEEVL